MSDPRSNSPWFKSSHSGPEGGNCLEAAGIDDSVGVRDSKDTARGRLAVSPGAWATFTASVKR